MANHDILADILGEHGDKKTLTETVDFIARKEQAENERGTVSGDVASNNLIKQSNNTGSDGRKCWACNGDNHGGDR